jgi:hypothetical protein
MNKFLVLYFQKLSIGVQYSVFEHVFSDVWVLYEGISGCRKSGVVLYELFWLFSLTLSCLLETTSENLIEQIFF